MVKFGKRLCELSPISRWNPSRTKLTDNSITTGNSCSDPKLRKFGGLIEAIGDSATEKEVTHTSPSVMQISIWPVIRLEARDICWHNSHYDSCPPCTIYLFRGTVIHKSRDAHTSSLLFSTPFAMSNFTHTSVCAIFFESF